MFIRKKEQNQHRNPKENQISCWGLYVETTEKQVSSQLIRDKLPKLHGDRWWADLVGNAPRKVLWPLAGDVLEKIQAL